MKAYQYRVMSIRKQRKKIEDWALTGLCVFGSVYLAGHIYWWVTR